LLSRPRRIDLELAKPPVFLPGSASVELFARTPPVVRAFEGAPWHSECRCLSFGCPSSLFLLCAVLTAVLLQAAFGRGCSNFTSDCVLMAASHRLPISFAVARAAR